MNAFIYKNKILSRIFFLLSIQTSIFCGYFEMSEVRGELSGAKVLKLLEKFPNFENASLPGGDTPLHVACRWGLYDVFCNILNGHGVNIHAANNNGDTPLLVAAFYGYRLFIEKLITSGAEIDGRGYDGDTALHCAAAEGKLNVLTFLLNTGAIFDLKDNCGNTPLHCAVLRGHTRCVKQLLLHGASIHQNNNEGDTPLSLASDDDLYNLLYNSDKQNSVVRKKINREDSSEDGEDDEDSSEDEEDDEEFDIF